jgi:alpha-galactosidase
MKITFLGAGSTVFARNVLGDCMLAPSLADADIALYDIDATRLKESELMLRTLNKNINESRAKITSYLGVANRRKALAGADFVINAIQVGGYKPSTVIDFEIPRKYGLRQTIADTLGIGGIFRALRTIPVMFDFAHDMERVCPGTLFINYTNPMAMLTGAMLRATPIRTVGLCHSVQAVVGHLSKSAGIDFRKKYPRLKTRVAGINHMAWLLEISQDNKDLYPMIKKKAAAILAAERAKRKATHWDLVRLEMMMQFGYYITESSEHNAEYHPYFIKSKYPRLISEFNIPLDEYPRRCIRQIERWKTLSKELVHNPSLTHRRSEEYASYIIEAVTTGKPFSLGASVMNTGLITNLPANACVEVPCVANRAGVSPCYVGDLPEQCAALNRTNINVQLLTIQAALTKKRDYIYQAAMLDPHTASELTIDQIRNMCDDLIKAHGRMLPQFR